MRYRLLGRCAVILLSWTACSVVAAELAPTEAAPPPAGLPDLASEARREPPNLALRNALIIGTGAAGIAAYGQRQWWSDGFDGQFETVNEHWFSQSTQHGGADKLGHAYGNYAGVRLLTPLFETVGNTRRASLSLAFWSTLLAYSAVEVADGYSRKYAFSEQDFTANIAGALFGLAMETHPRLDEFLDFRFYYRRSDWETRSDPFGDYSGQRFLLVLKADAVPALRENMFTRYLEVSAGYGVNVDYGGLHRNRYLGLSLNLSRLMADGFYGGRKNSSTFQNAADRAFELFQFPTAVYRRSEI